MFERDPLFVIMVLLLCSAFGLLGSMGLTIALAKWFPGRPRPTRVRTPNPETY